MSDVKQRVKKLEQQAGGEEAPLVWVDWGPDCPTVTIAGEVLSREEAARRYPDARVVGWEDPEP